MPAVTIYQKAFTDHRITMLGIQLGTDHKGALIQLVYVWSACTESSTYTLSKQELHAITGNEHFASALVQCGLGAALKGGQIRIRGTKDRVEWLENRRRIGRETGQRGAEHGIKGGRPRKPGNPVNENPVTGLQKPADRDTAKPPDFDFDSDSLKTSTLPKKRKSKKTKISRDWKPSEELREWSAREYPQINLDAQVFAFTRWYLSAGRTSEDWNAALEIWIAREAQRQGGADVVQLVPKRVSSNVPDPDEVAFSKSLKLPTQQPVGGSND